MSRRSQLPNPLTDGSTKRNTDTGRFVEGKEGPKPFKGVHKEKGKLDAASPSPNDEEVGVALDAPSVEDVKAAFAEEDLTVTVEERTLALTASADGGMLIGIFIGITFNEFARLMVDDAYAGIKNLLRRFVRRGADDYSVFVRHEGIDALINADLPLEAFLKLQGKLPSAPSGRIVYNRDARRWQDSEQ
ncbi:MAG TPA: hypothetical protein VND89_08885 [Acidimicrobiales bacterium]|nr:hypothetical protein [Acidimicrobiales bacterium]